MKDNQIQKLKDGKTIREERIFLLKKLFKSIFIKTLKLKIRTSNLELQTQNPIVSKNEEYFENEEVKRNI